MSTEPPEVETGHLATLREHRALLLGCEAIGWLHMTGKAHPDFLRAHGGQSNKHEVNEWVDSPNVDWNTRLKWLRLDSMYAMLPADLTDFWKQYDKGDVSNLVSLLQAGHAMASGIEKNVPKSGSEYLGQDVTHMWLTTPFGHPVRNLLVDPPEILKTGGRDDLIERTCKLLESLKELATGSVDDVDEWFKWRDGAIGHEGWLREAYTSTLAETRIPNNDVTLWDQSYIAAALFKAAVAGAILSPCSNWSDLKKNTQWRVFTVAFGAEHYEARSVRIADWTGTRQKISELFDKVCRLIEVDLAVGSLVYRDDRVLAFTFPGLRADANADDAKGSVIDSDAETRRGEIETAVDKIAQEFELETPPRCCLSSSTRSFVPVAGEITKARSAVEIPIHRVWSTPTPRGGTGHVCPVCQVRKSKCSNDKQRVCEVCDRRRKGRLDAWSKEGGDTIWIDEVADENDRVALLTISLDLDKWLDGSNVDSLRAQSIPEWAQRNALSKGIQTPNNYNSLSSLMLSAVPEKGNVPSKIRAQILGKLSDGYKQSDWPSPFFENLVEDRSDAPGWDSLDDKQQAAWLAHQLFRKNASPGRIHRFWRTTEQFFGELLISFREMTSRHENRWRVRRLIVTPKESTERADNETYTAVLNQAPLELLYRASTGDFLTISNLARVLGANNAAESLKGQTIELTSDSGDLNVTVAKVSEADRLGVYSPLIVLEQSPERFRVLVPLSAADSCIEAAIAKWDEEMARVWDRLPVRVGIVGFPRKTTYQAVVEAARNVEDDLAAHGNETWRVRNARTRDGVTALSLVRRDGEPELVMVPERLPDGREDVFYSYCLVEDQVCRDKHDFRAPNKGGRVYRRMAALKEGDGIHVAPSLIAAVFLDSTARRFDPADIRPLGDWKRMEGIWRLVTEHAPSQTALIAAASAIYDAKHRWSDLNGALSESARQTWLDFVRSLLVTEWGVSGAALDTLVDAARTGTFQWAISWHMRAQKLALEDRQ